MRLDKYLKVARVIRRRSVAKELGDQGRVTINDRVAKSGTRVSVGDQIMIQFGNRRLTIEVVNVRDTTKKHEAEGMYRVVSEERVAPETP